MHARRTYKKKCNSILYDDDVWMAEYDERKYIYLQIYAHTHTPIQRLKKRVRQWVGECGWCAVFMTASMRVNDLATRALAARIFFIYIKWRIYIYFSIYTKVYLLHTHISFFENQTVEWWCGGERRAQRGIGQRMNNFIDNARRAACDVCILYIKKRIAYQLTAVFVCVQVGRYINI